MSDRMPDGLVGEIVDWLGEVRRSLRRVTWNGGSGWWSEALRRRGRMHGLRRKWQRPWDKIGGCDE
jgi:hypothetical protein